MREVDVRLLPTGSTRHPQAMARRGASWRPGPFPALPALIQHPSEGPIVFDTGYSQAFSSATDPWPERLYRLLTPMQLDEGDDLASRCRGLGIAPAEVRHVVVSHFHADHIAGLCDFPTARIHCARAGLAGTQRGRWRALCAGLLPALLPQDLPRRAVFFEDGPAVALPGAALPFTDGVDILGDGSLLAVELPGHCPGHWGLLVADRALGWHFLVADAAWSLESIRRNIPPPALTTAFLGSSRPYLDTLAKLHALHRRHPGLVLSPYHCAERATQLPDAQSSPPALVQDPQP